MRWTFDNGKQVDEEEQERIAEMLKQWFDADNAALKELKVDPRRSSESS